MKTILITLAIAGFVATGAKSQTQTDAATTTKPATNNSVQTAKGNNYQVCKEMGGYYTCCTHHDQLVAKNKKHAAGRQTLVATHPKKLAANSSQLATNSGSVKPVHHIHHAKRAQSSTAIVDTSAVACHLEAYYVFEIMPDRKTVMSYKTTDLQNLTPMNDERTYYGPTGPMPDELPKPGIKTIVINTAEKQANHCERDEKNKTTVCYHNGSHLVRDANGYYSYGD